jgi:hypothetical protein
VVAQAVFAPGRITYHRVMGAILLYLTIGVTFLALYTFLGLLIPAAFSGMCRIPRRPNLLRLRHADPAKAEDLGEMGIGKIWKSLRLLDLWRTAESAKLPRHHVEVAIVEHYYDQARIAPFAPKLADGNQTVDAEHLHGAVSDNGNRDAVGMTEFRRCGVGYGATHGSESA